MDNVGGAKRNENGAALAKGKSLMRQFERRSPQRS